MAEGQTDEGFPDICPATAVRGARRVVAPHKGALDVRRATTGRPYGQAVGQMCK